MPKPHCCKCPLPRAHPTSPFCVEHRREYNRDRRARLYSKTEDVNLPEEDTPGPDLEQELREHLEAGGRCADFKQYWAMSPREVSAALDWYRSKRTQSSSES